MDKETLIYILLGTPFVWLGIGSIGNFIRKHYFYELDDPSNILLGPICIIMSGIEALIIKHQKPKVKKDKKRGKTTNYI